MMVNEAEKKIIVYGCGGHARSLINTILKNGYQGSLILVDKNALDDEEILGCKVRKAYELKEQDVYIVGIGDNLQRKSFFLELQKKSDEALTLIASGAEVGIEAKIGAGTFVAAKAYIGPCCKIGDNTIINTGSIIEHETVIGEHTHIAVNATISGRCKIGNNVFCGAGSTVIDKISICDNVTVGAGSVVISDICEPGVYVGVPARKMDS